MTRNASREVDSFLQRKFVYSRLQNSLPMRGFTTNAAKNAENVCILENIVDFFSKNTW